MSFVAHGLKCTSCDCRDPHVFYRRSDGPPTCPICSGARIVDWSHGTFPGVKGGGLKSFPSVDMGVLGVCDTREKYDRAMQTIQTKFPGQQITVEGDTRHDKKQRADEARHRLWTSRKAQNIDAKQVLEMKAEAKGVKRTLKRGEQVNVSKAGTKVTKAG